MPVDQKNTMVESYIKNLSSQLNNQYKGIMDEDKIYRAIEMFKNSDKEYDDIIIEIQSLAQRVVYDYLEFQNHIQDYMQKQFTEDQLSTFALDMGQDANGLYLSQQQVDLLMITELTSKENIKNYIENICGQFPNKNIEDILPDFNLIENPDDNQLEKWKRSIYQQYTETLITYLQNTEMTGEEKARLKLSKLGLQGDELEEWVSKFESEGMLKTFQQLEAQYGSNFITKLNRYIRDDFENVGSISYDEMFALNDFIKRDTSIDTIIIATGKLDDIIYQTGKDKVFDPFFVQKGMQYCLSNGNHVRYHTLFGQSHVEKLIEAGKGVKDHDQIFAEMRAFVNQSFEFIEKNNITLPDGTKLINTIEVFNELIEKNKDDKDQPYEMVWEKHFGITIEEIMSCFDGIKKPDGVEFMYNEATLTESPFKRTEVEKVLYQIEQIRPNFIDSFGDQMHLSDEDVLSSKGSNNLSQTFEMLKRIQTGKLIVDGQEKQITGKKVECTEHDFHFTRQFLEQYQVVKDTNNLPESKLPSIKKGMQEQIASVAKEKGVNFTRTTYWSIFDKNDHNLCRANIKIHQENKKRQELGIKEKPLLNSMNAGLIKNDKKFSDKKTLKAVSKSEKASDARNKESKEPFDRRTPGEVKVAEQIREKNKVIAQRKKQQKQQAKPQTLVKKNPSFSPANKGYINIVILFLIISLVACMLFIIKHFLIK